jgi:hypothetical protein
MQPSALAAFRIGTHIATPSGEVPVESLSIGDVVLTASGARRAITHIAEVTRTAAEMLADPGLRPVRIRAGALAERLPRRDLVVSPDHALLLADPAGPVLVAAELLVDAGVVLRLSGADVAYVAISLETHDAILAERQPVETWAGADEQPYAARVTEGPALERIRARLQRRAEKLVVVRPVAASVVAEPEPNPVGELLGHVDHVDHQVIGGWALDGGDRHTPVLLDIVVDGVVVETVLADRPRKDLESVIPEGKCSFLVSLPAQLDETRLHIVYVRRTADGALLEGAPVLLDRAVPASDDNDIADLKGLLPAMSPDLPPDLPAAEALALLTAEIDRLRALRARLPD